MCASQLLPLKKIDAKTIRRLTQGTITIDYGTLRTLARQRWVAGRPTRAEPYSDVFQGLGLSKVLWIMV